MQSKYALALSFVVLVFASRNAPAADKVLRAGIIGCDTSHVEAFTKLINNPDAVEPYSAVKVVAAWPGGSPDLKKASMDRVPGYVKKLKSMGVKIVDSLDELTR